MVQIKRDQVTGQSKGFGFIRFENYDSQAKVLSKRHFISGRWCDVKIPDSKVSTTKLFSLYVNTLMNRITSQEGSDIHIPCKIFVGRVSESITVDDLRNYFSQFGEVTDVYIPKPFRSFAFVTFDSPDTAQNLIGEDHVIKGVSVHVSEASPRYSNARMSRQRNNPFSGMNWPMYNKSPNKNIPTVDGNAAALLSAIAGNPSVLAAVNQIGMNFNKTPNNNGRNQKHDYGNSSFGEQSHFVYQ